MLKVIPHFCYDVQIKVDWIIRSETPAKSEPPEAVFNSAYNLSISNKVCELANS